MSLSHTVRIARMDTAHCSGEVVAFGFFPFWLVYRVEVVCKRVNAGALEKVVGAFFENMRERERVCSPNIPTVRVEWF